ncbi:hypothetical protein E0W47_10620 [Neisseria meningitidis]|nr:hypothetical protein [Neisseria meningitidis]
MSGFRRHPTAPSFPRKRESKNPTLQKFISETTETAPPSFPRRRESSPAGNGNIQRLSESLKF